MANMSVDSAAFAKLTSALQGQSVALNKLTSELGADNKREFLQKAKPITIQSVQTRQGMRPFDTAIAEAVARAQTPASKVIVEREREEGLLSKIAKGILGVGAVAIIFKSIQNNPALKNAFNATVTTIKDFFVGPEGIITKALGFLTDGTGGEILRDIENTIMGMFPEDGFMRSLATTGVQAIKTVFSAIETLIDYIKNPDKIYEDITSLIGGVMAGGAQLLGDSLKKAGLNLGSIFGGGGGGGILGILTGDPKALQAVKASFIFIGAEAFALIKQLVEGGEGQVGVLTRLGQIESAVDRIMGKIKLPLGIETIIDKITNIKFGDIAKALTSLGKFADVKVQTAIMFTLVQLNNLADKLPSIADEFANLEYSVQKTMNNKTLGRIVDLFSDTTKMKDLTRLFATGGVAFGKLPASIQTLIIDKLMPAAATGAATPGGAAAASIIAPITNLDRTIGTLKTAIDTLADKIEAMKTAAFVPGDSNEEVASYDFAAPNQGYGLRDMGRMA